MKKRLYLSVLVSICLLTGCTKNYKTVSDYENAMATIRDNQPCYTMEVKQSMGTISMYYKSYIKDKKWKTETSMNGGSSYMTGMIYDGDELLQYNQGSPYAIINPGADFLKDQTDEEMRMGMSMINPPAALLYWNSSITADSSTAKFGNKKETKNGFECRMIEYGDTEEVCVSDKYGVAVYRKMKDAKVGDITYDLVKIDTSDIDDSTFQLPAGIKKMNFDSLLQEMESKMNSFRFDD